MSQTRTITNMTAMRMIIDGQQAANAQSIVVDPISLYNISSWDRSCRVPYFIGDFAKGIDAFKEVVAKTAAPIILEFPDSDTGLSYLYVRTKLPCGYLPMFKFPKGNATAAFAAYKAELNYNPITHHGVFIIPAEAPVMLSESQVSEFTVIFRKTAKGENQLFSVIPGHFRYNQTELLPAGEYTIDELRTGDLSDYVFDITTKEPETAAV